MNFLFFYFLPTHVFWIKMLTCIHPVLKMCVQPYTLHILIDLIHILRGKSNKSHVQKKKTPIISTLVQELPASPPLSAAAIWGRHSEWPIRIVWFWDKFYAGCSSWCNPARHWECTSLYNPPLTGVGALTRNRTQARAVMATSPSGNLVHKLLMFKNKRGAQLVTYNRSCMR